MRCGLKAKVKQRKWLTFDTNTIREGMRQLMDGKVGGRVEFWLDLNLNQTFFTFEMAVNYASFEMLHHLNSANRQYSQLCEFRLCVALHQKTYLLGFRKRTFSHLIDEKKKLRSVKNFEVIIFPEYKYTFGFTSLGTQLNESFGQKSIAVWLPEINEHEHMNVQNVLMNNFFLPSPFVLNGVNKQCLVEPHQSSHVFTRSTRTDQRTAYFFESRQMSLYNEKSK